MQSDWYQQDQGLHREEQRADLGHDDEANSDDVRRADEAELGPDPDPRLGLEGLATTRGEVVGFDEVKLFLRSTPDSTALICFWLLVLGSVVVSVWARSIVLGLLTVIVVVLATWWTTSKFRAWWAAEREMRRAESEESPSVE